MLQVIDAMPAMSWVKSSISLQRIDKQVVYLQHRQSSSFITDRQRQQLEELIGQILSRRVRVEFVTADNRPAKDSSQTPNADTNSEHKPMPQADDRDVALRLPLVREIFDVFGRATLLGVRSEDKPGKELSADQPTGEGDSDVPNDAEPLDGNNENV